MALPKCSRFAAYARAAALILAFSNLGAGPHGYAKVESVIELFTSQGCSFCPRADQLLAGLAREPGIIAISFPVDYWDFIGWKDTLASPAFTARQKAYAAAHGEEQIYTPQVIINGVTGAPGGDREEIEQAIKSAKGLDGALTVPIRLSEKDGHYLVEVAGGGGGPAGVFVLRVVRASTVHVWRGENAGRALTYTNVVRTIDKLGDWSGETATFDMPAGPSEGEGFVVLVQKGTLERPGTILAAAKTEGF
jgi:hypothetical protein